MAHSILRRGAHVNYYGNLLGTIQGLMALGWSKESEIPLHGEEDTRALWRWLVREAESDFLSFSEDAFYSANWDVAERDRVREKVLDHLKRETDVDLIIAMGTWAGTDLANDEHNVPTIVMSTSDPIKAGIIRSAENSGYSHVHARVDPGRYERQLRVFHDIIGFQKLGVAYEDTLYGRAYAAIDAVEKVAAERGFDLVRCHTQSDIADRVAAGKSVVTCFQELARSADAVYLTIQWGVNTETIPELVTVANRYRIPTFSQLGSQEVRNGMLLSLSRPGFRPVRRFLAATIAKILNGAKPGRLNQIFEEAPNIAINLKTAELVGVYLYADVLAAADEVYRDIEVAH
jgi:ABC-type uncharacterized transport system substrate-binding protein